MPKPEPIVDRFWKHVVEIGGPMDTPCWTHRRNPNSKKNWHIGAKGGNVSARVWAFEHIGRKPIPAGHVVMSYCENAACCNPAHMFTGTRGDMMRATAADGKVTFKHLRKYREANRLRFTGMGNPNAKHSDEVVQRVRSLEHLTAREVKALTGVCRSQIYRIWAGVARAGLPRKSENPPIFLHGHRGTGTQAHRREAGSGDGQAHDHQDPFSGLREPHGSGAVLG